VATAQISPLDPYLWLQLRSLPQTHSLGYSSSFPHSLGYSSGLPLQTRPTASGYKKLILVTSTLVYTKTVETVTVETVVLTYHYATRKGDLASDYTLVKTLMPMGCIPLKLVILHRR